MFLAYFNTKADSSAHNTFFGGSFIALVLIKNKKQVACNRLRMCFAFISFTNLTIYIQIEEYIMLKDTAFLTIPYFTTGYSSKEQKQTKTTRVRIPS